MGDDVAARVGEAFSFYGKAEAVKHLLQPPVGNHLIFGKKEALKVMFVGGPNVRPDYHINEGEELFFQLKGPLDLKIVEHNRPRTVRVEEGHMFCLPARVPHSPQRHANSCGLVIERERLPEEIDGLRWFVDDSSAVAAEEEKGAGLQILFESYFHCFDLGVQLKPLILNYLESDAHRTRVPPPGFPVANPPIVVDSVVDVPAPFNLNGACDHIPANSTTALDLGPANREFTVQVVKGSFDGSLLDTFPGGTAPKEMFVWRKGEAADDENVSVISAGGAASWTLISGDSCYIRPSAQGGEELKFHVTQTAGTLLLFYNRVYQCSPNFTPGEE
jgi:3-hydroxyanthranilate 3,4-dioxygenase